MKLTKSELQQFRAKGIFTDSQATITPNNIGVPAGLLTSLSPTIIENVLAKRSAEKILGGTKKLIDWADEDYQLPFAETTAKVTAYNDYGQPLNSSLNLSFNRYGHYRFTAKSIYGSLQQEQYSKAKIDYASMVLTGTLEALAIESNRTAFYGYQDNTSGKFLVQGLFNNPALSNYVVATKTFATMTDAEILAFFATAISDLTVQTGGVIDGLSVIRVPIATTSFAQLQSKHTTLGISIYDQLLKTYPSMTFEPAIELNKAHLNTDVIYFIGESMAGGIADTTTLGYSEINRAGNVVMGDNTFSQAFSSGSVGAVVYKPFMIKRYSGV